MPASNTAEKPVPEVGRRGQDCIPAIWSRPVFPNHPFRRVPPRSPSAIGNAVNRNGEAADTITLVNALVRC